ncbi:MAG: asparaginase [Lachnospira sp.]|nr:asparaginase [Lachnospira sp.]
MEQQKKILVVLTGGTIGSVIDDDKHVIQTDKRSTYRLIRKYEDNFGVNQDFVIEQPYNILSENINLDIWSKLCRYIWSKNLENYAGVIITHGTDTYSYTAALMSTLFDNYVDIPVVLVSSNYALGEPLSNGLSNFRNAVCFIRQETGREHGVFCIYENNKGVPEVFRGAEITEADTCIDQFGVYGGEVYGHMINESFVKNLNHKPHCIFECSEKSSFKWEENSRLDKAVILLKNYPGMNYDYINLDSPHGKPAAVVQYLYHSGTACVDAEFPSNSFIEFAKKCNAQGINVYAAGIKRQLKDEYATMKAYEQADIIRLYDCSLEAAYVNVLLKENLNN